MAEVNKTKVSANPYDETCAICEKDVAEKLEVAKSALQEKDLSKYHDALTALKKSVEAHNNVIRKRAYTTFLAAENPMIAAVEAFHIDCFKVKEEKAKDSEAVVGISTEKKKARIDLDKFCEFGELPREWAHLSAKLLALLSLREVNLYSLKPSDIAKKSYYFAVAVDAKKKGETPDSNTQIVKLLQQIIDEAIFVDDGNGKNKYKCTNHDLAFIQDAVTKMDTKEKCTIAMLNERQFKTVMMSVFAHCLGEAYKVKPAKVKSES